MTRKVSNSHYVNNQERAIEFITTKTSFDSYLITLCLWRPVGRVHSRKLTYPEVIAWIIVMFGKESPRMSCCTLVSSRRMMMMMMCHMGYFPFENGRGETDAFLQPIFVFCRRFHHYSETTTV